MTLFSGTHLQVRRLDGWLKRRGLAQGCALLGFVDIAPHFGGEIPQKPQFWGLNRRFQAKLVKTKEITYYQNYYIDSNQILHSDKDHQIPFVGGPNTHIINPRWRTAAILEKSKNRYISAVN